MFCDKDIASYRQLLDMALDLALFPAYKKQNDYIVKNDGAE